MTIPERDRRECRERVDLCLPVTPDHFQRLMFDKVSAAIDSLVNIHSQRGCSSLIRPFTPLTIVDRCRPTSRSLGLLAPLVTPHDLGLMLNGLLLLFAFHLGQHLVDRGAANP